MDSELIQLTFSGLSLGATYALITLGFVVIYQSSQIFNFAHGEFVTIGGFCMITMTSIGLPWPFALIAAMVMTGFLAVGIERVVIRPMIGKPVFVTIILTLFVAYLLRALIIVIWDTDPHGMPTPWQTDGSMEIFGAQILYNTLGTVVAGIVGLVAFFILLKYTKIGIGMRATNADQEVALALGIPVGRIFQWTWFLAGMYAAAAGVFLSMFPQNLDMNLSYVALRAFPAVIVGLTSPIGAVIAAIILGLSEVLAQRYIEPLLGEFGRNIHTVFPYVLMIAFLMVRPYGIFGKQDVERV